MPHVKDIVGDFNPALPWFMEALDPSVYMGDDFVIFDLETTNLDFGSALNPNNSIVCASWCVGPTRDTCYIRGGEFDLGALLECIDKAEFVIAHNTKFELQWLARMGVDIGKILPYDTLLGEYVLRGNRNHIRLDLDSVGERYGVGCKEPIVGELISSGVCPSTIPADLLKRRVRRDVATTRAVFLKQREILNERRLLPTVFTRCILTPVLADMETKGVRLDEARVTEEYGRALREYNLLSTEFAAFTGGINPRSPAQMAHFLYGKDKDLGQLGFAELTHKRRGGLIPIRNKPSKQFPDGVPLTDDDTLAKLKATNKRQREFVALRAELGVKNAEITKTLDFFKRVCDERGGRFYGRFNQAVTQTQRLSSSAVKVTFADGEEKGVQFQNFPRKFKDLIGPLRDGDLVVDIDGSQLEFRVAAFVGQDPVAISDIRNNEDIHRFTASVLLQKPEDAISKAERTAAKPDTFKPLYGGQRGTPAQERYYEAFRKKYKAIYDTQKGWTNDVLLTRRLTTCTGLRFYWPHTTVRPDGYISNTPSIFNYPIQSLATSEIIPIALTYLWHRLRANAPDVIIFNTIHDSVLASCPPDMVQSFSSLGIQSFTLDVYYYLERVYGLDFNVPLGAGIAVGKRWNGDITTEIELNVERDGSYWVK